MVNGPRKKRRKAYEINRDFLCKANQCGKGFGTKSALLRHIRSKHPSMEDSIAYDRYRGKEKSNKVEYDFNVIEECEKNLSIEIDEDDLKERPFESKIEDLQIRKKTQEREIYEPYERENRGNDNEKESEKNDDREIERPRNDPFVIGARERILESIVYNENRIDRENRRPRNDHIHLVNLNFEAYYFNFGEWAINIDFDPFSRIVSWIDVDKNCLSIDIFYKDVYYVIESKFKRINLYNVSDNITRIIIFTLDLPKIFTSSDKLNWISLPKGHTTNELVIETLDGTVVRRVDEYTLSRIEKVSNSHTVQEQQISKSNYLYQALSLFERDV